MAGYPPPYPPYSADPRQQRRMLREQAKAQRAMFRAQRDLYRRQARMTVLKAASMRRSSILGPLIVVAVGVVLLLIRMGWLPFSRFAVWYGRWWPLLFVAGGLVLVLEWAFDQRTKPEATPYQRRGAAGSIFLLLLVLAVSGAVVHAGTGNGLWAHGLNIDSDNWAEFVGDKHEREQTLNQSFPPGTSLSIDDPHGDITVTGKSDDQQIHIVAYKQVYSESDADADEKADELSPQVAVSGGRLSVVVPSKAGGSVDLTVTVPDFAETTINSGRGDVHVTGLKSPLSVTADHGDVEVTDIQGAVATHLNHRDSSFSAHNLRGDVSLKGNADDLNLTDVTGAATLDGDFYGDTHLEHIGGATSFHTSRTSFSFARLDGSVDISPEAELTGDQIVGPTMLATRSRNISLERVSGALNVTDSNGSVELQSAPPGGDVTVYNHGGSVTLTVPEGTGFDLHAETNGGEISNDFGLPTTATDRTKAVTGTVGSGQSHVSISTTHGDITIRKGAAVPAAPAAAPAATQAPATAKKIASPANF